MLHCEIVIDWNGWGDMLIEMMRDLLDGVLVDRCLLGVILSRGPPVKILEHGHGTEKH